VEAAEELASLLAHCLERRFMLRQRWAPGSLLVWDNTAVWHRATVLEMAPAARAQRRAMFRASVLSDARPSVASGESS
jgi:alpha-ketoglutarate-dependent taurine dioxygenase